MSQEARVGRPVNQGPIVVAQRVSAYLLIAVLAGLGLIATACATTAVSADEKTTKEPVGEPPDEVTPVDGSAGREVPRDVVAEMAASDNQSTASGSGETERGDEEASTVEASVVRHETLLDIFDQGPGWLLQQVELEPVHREGAFRGYRIGGASDSALEAMTPELAVGDVITEVNGVALERPNDYLEAWSRLPRVEQVKIEYVRDGQVEKAVWRVVRGDRDG